jgi:signal peptidase I
MNKAAGYEAPPMTLVREYYETILVSAVFILFAWTFVVTQSKIPSASMEDTLLIGDRVFVNKFVYGVEASPWIRRLLPYRDIRRGDVVVFKSLHEPDKDFIKRVVGVGGDRIEVVNKVLYVNGEPRDEPYVKFLRRDIIGRGEMRGIYGMSPDNWGPFTVPQGSYFMMGDNRDNSSDSRVFGPVRREFIKGEAVMIFWSIQQPGSWEDPLDKQAVNTLRSVVNFFSWTRWDRIFRLVD